MRRRGFVGAGVAGTAAVLVLGGCAGSIAERSYRGLPDDSTAVAPTTAPTGRTDLPDPELGPRVQWTSKGRLLAVSLWGSSTCPVEPTGLTQVGHDYLTVEVTRRSGFLGACTADLAVNTFEIRVPDSVATDGSVTVRVDGREFTLAPR